MLASEEKRDEAGSEEYQEDHFGKILKEGFSFSGFERDHLYLNREGQGFQDISGLTGIDSDTGVSLVHYPESQGLLESLMGGDNAIGDAARWWVHRELRREVRQTRELLEGQALTLRSFRE